MKPTIIACIPAYDEERTIARVVIEVGRYVDKVIVCDDGSKDLTGEIAGRLGAEVIRHERNMGYGAALHTLFKRAREIDPDVMVVLLNPCIPVLHRDQLKPCSLIGLLGLHGRQV